MDEPSTGLDPASRHNLWNVVKRAKQDRAIILTSTLSLPPICVTGLSSVNHRQDNDLFFLLVHLQSLFLYQHIPWKRQRFCVIAWEFL